MARIKGLAVVVGLALGIAAGCGGSSEKAPSEGGSKSTGNPMSDPAAWSALAGPERAKLVSGLVADTNYRSIDSVKKAHSLLVERGEATAAADVLARRLSVDANCAWAHGARHEVEVRERVKQCLSECELAEAENTASFVSLQKIVGAETGPKWVDEATSKKVEALIAEMHKDETRLGDPHAASIDKWVRWQRGYPVMKDFAEVHATSGPYLVFVSFGSASGRPTPAAENAATTVLEHHVKILRDVHAAWVKEIAGPLSLTTYDEKSVDEKTLLKADVFTDAKAFWSYQFEADWWSASEFTGAHYVDSEPRFLAMVEAGNPLLQDGEGAIATEAVRQLVHFHTWDVTRKAQGREVDFAQCKHRPLWSADGFPVVFARLVVAPGGKSERTWLPSIFVGRAVCAARSWTPWTLAEVLAMKDRTDLAPAARRHATGAPADVAVEPMIQLFRGRIASLVDFLWNAQESGRPKYRERYLRYLGSEMSVKTKVDFTKTEVCVRLTPDDFRRAMGLTADDAFAAFEKEWNGYESEVLAKEKQPDWAALASRAVAAVDDASKKAETK